MELARIFQDGIVLQRNKKICVWGETECTRHIITKLNGKIISDDVVPKGSFTIFLPEQKEQTDVTLEIGDIILRQVDFGEVWIASGQSNMEFELDNDAQGADVIGQADDDHFRMYTVGRYSYAGQREEGYKSWNPWDEWKPFIKENAGRFSAAATYFALKLRKNGIPVGIINVSWGGTQASSWIDEKILKNDEQLKVYIEDFKNGLAKFDLEELAPIKEEIRKAMSAQEMKASTDFIMKVTKTPEEFMSILAEGDGSANSNIPMEYLSVAAPGDENEPGALYRNMLSEVVGIGARGVIWYQGESDERHADLYERLFSAMIACWRTSWKEKNPDITELPFLYVQLAPYGIWMQNTSINYPTLREQQELLSKKVTYVWMTSISDSGNVFDIHPKYKRPVGERLEGLAEKYVYHWKKDALVEAPEAVDMEVEAGKITISFDYGDELRLEDRDMFSYNGFSVEVIPEDLLPHVLCGVNGLEVVVDEKSLENRETKIRFEENTMQIVSSQIMENSQVSVDFARTPFYQVNLYNKAGIPAKPFRFVRKQEFQHDMDCEEVAK